MCSILIVVSINIFNFTSKIYIMLKSTYSLIFLLLFSIVGFSQIKRSPVIYNEDSLKTAKHDTVDEHYVEFTGLRFFTLKFGVNSFPFGSNSVDYYAGMSPNNYIAEQTFQYGKGYELKANYGKYLTENIAFEWNLQAIIGAKNGLSYRFSDSSLVYSASSSYSCNSYLTGPSVTYQSKGNYWFLYARAGALFGVSTKTIDENYNVYDNNGGGYYGKFKFNTSESGGITSGYTIDLGIMKKIDKYHLLFVEIGYNSLTNTFKNATLNTGTFNDYDVLYSYDTYEKETVFVDKLTNTSNTDPNKPYEEVKYKTILSSIGIKFGCKFLLH